jgi:hypothetical protein
MPTPPLPRPRSPDVSDQCSNRWSARCTSRRNATATTGRSHTAAWISAGFDATEIGLIDDTGFTDEGRDIREAVEVATDIQMEPAIRALGDHVDELFSIMGPWGVTVRAGKGYLASGPHDLGGRR